MDGTAKCSVASVSKRSNDKTSGVAEVLIIIFADGINDANYGVIVCPVISQLGLPRKVIYSGDIGTMQIIQHVSIVNIQDDHSL